MGLLSKSLKIIRNYGLREYVQAVRLYLLDHPIADDIWWHFNRLVRSQPRVIRNVHGCRMLLDISQNGIHKQLFLHGCHEPECTRIFREMLLRDARVVDIGANIGYYALIEAQVAQKVYAIEPEPRNLELLRENIKLNSCGNRIEVHELAISDTIGKALLHISGVPNQHRLLASPDVRQARCIEVATTTLDEFVKDKEVDVIRMDLEGAEWLVIKGMTEILRGNKPLLLFIEIHPRLIKDYGGDATMLLEILLESGFKLRHLAAVLPPPSFPIRQYIKAHTPSREQAIECHAPLGNPLLDKYLRHIIMEKSVFYRVFMER